MPGGCSHTPWMREAGCLSVSGCMEVRRLHAAGTTAKESPCGTLTAGFPRAWLHLHACRLHAARINARMHQNAPCTRAAATAKGPHLHACSLRYRRDTCERSKTLKKPEPAHPCNLHINRRKQRPEMRHCPHLQGAHAPPEAPPSFSSQGVKQQVEVQRASARLHHQEAEHLRPGRGEGPADARAVQVLGREAPP